MGIAGMMGMGGPQSGPQMSLLGGESMLGQNAKKESVNKSDGNSDGDPEKAVAGADTEGDESAQGPQLVDRPAQTVTGDAMVDEYTDLVDAYFEKLTSKANE